MAKLGDEVALSDESGGKAWDFARLINNRYVLGVLILLVAAVLVVSLYQAGKRVEASSADEEPGQNAK